MKLQKVAVSGVFLICGGLTHAGPPSEPVREVADGQSATDDRAAVMYERGVMYDEGLGVQRDDAAAYRL